MFEKGKQWWKDRKIQEHLENNKDLYKGLGVGIVSVLILKDVLHPGGRTAQINVAPVIAPVFNNMPVFNNDNSSVVNFGGQMSKIVKCKETGEIWEKMLLAAESEGVPKSLMSKHLNGHEDAINGKHFEIIGLRTTG